QEQGVDFEEVFAPVTRMESVRLVIALAAQESWKLHHMDVKSVFLNGELKEEVYVKQPPGYIKEGEEHKVLKLHKALYGLYQAPRAWNIKLDRTLISLGFEKSPLEHAMYKRGKGKDRLLVGIYVDDLLITGADEEEIARFKLQMKELFKMSDLGLLTYYLGIEVHQKPEGITLCQEAYAKKILESCSMEDCNPSFVPIEPRLKLSKRSEASAVDATEYRSVVGSLRYLVNTRPDLAYSVGIVSRFMEAPTTEHWAAVKHILRYIKGTTNFGCVYLREKKEMVELLGYSDSDLAGDVDDRKSTSGVAYFLGGSIVTWLSQKQKVVALSSCEAEYIAAATAAGQGVWLGRLLGDLTDKEAESVVLNVDNKSAIALCKNPVHHDRTKHIDIRYHYIRECVEESKIEVNYVCTDDQLADILTKSLGRQKFTEMRGRIGVQAVK
uniref:Reverse transcriptase Ty1/copia-type domain-containing protein n=1 Tax=Aegilops tauschii subsp. strangulata TaxID=200361 RepID=A0A453B0H4_AEGTS